MRLLLDENISPALVGRLADVGVYAQSVPHVGLAGRADHAVWKYALDHDFAVLTINARDFIELLDVAVVSRQNLVRVENAAIPLVPRIEKRAWTQVSVALRSAKVLFRTWGHPAYIYKDG